MTSNFNFEEGNYYFLSTKLNDTVSSYGFLIHIKNLLSFLVVDRIIMFYNVDTFSLEEDIKINKEELLENFLTVYKIDKNLWDLSKNTAQKLTNIKSKIIQFLRRDYINGQVVNLSGFQDVDINKCYIKITPSYQMIKVFCIKNMHATEARLANIVNIYYSITGDDFIYNVASKVCTYDSLFSGGVVILNTKKVYYILIRLTNILSMIKDSFCEKLIKIINERN